jgi:hypothetical protein
MIKFNTDFEHFYANTYKSSFFKFVFNACEFSLTFLRCLVNVSFRDKESN